MCRSKLAEVLEKIVKAELLRLGWFLIKTHDLLLLAEELETRQSDLTPQVRPLVTALGGAYLVDRYPGFDQDEPDWPALRSQVAAVTSLLEAVKGRLVQS